MYKIAICDDMKLQTDKIGEYVGRFAGETSEEVEIFKFHDGFSLLSASYDKFDIIFLDIKMPGMTGLEAAKKIREKNKHVTLIFLTSIIQYAVEGYKVNAMEYLLKPLGYKRFKSVLLDWMEKQVPAEEPFTIVVNEKGSYRVELKSLKYVETYNRRLLFHTKDQEIYCTRKMREVEQELTGEGFFRCHTGYLINMGYVKNVVGLEVQLMTGESVNVSKLKKKEFMQALAGYWGDRL